MKYQRFLMFKFKMFLGRPAQAFMAKFSRPAQANAGHRRPAQVRQCLLSIHPYKKQRLWKRRVFIQVASIYFVDTLGVGRGRGRGRRWGRSSQIPRVFTWEFYGDVNFHTKTIKQIPSNKHEWIISRKLSLICFTLITRQASSHILKANDDIVIFGSLNDESQNEVVQCSCKCRQSCAEGLAVI